MSQNDINIIIRSKLDDKQIKDPKDIQNQLNDMAKNLKLNIGFDVKSFNELSKQINNVKKIVGDLNKNLKIFDAEEVQKSGAKVFKTLGDAKKQFKDLGQITFPNKSFDPITKELNSFTIQIQKADGLIEKLKFDLVNLAKGGNLDKAFMLKSTNQIDNRTKIQEQALQKEQSIRNAIQKETEKTQQKELTNLQKIAKQRSELRKEYNSLTNDKFVPQSQIKSFSSLINGAKTQGDLKKAEQQLLNIRAIQKQQLDTENKINQVRMKSYQDSLKNEEKLNKLHEQALIQNKKISQQRSNLTSDYQNKAQNNATNLASQYGRHVDKKALQEYLNEVNKLNASTPNLQRKLKDLDKQFKNIQTSARASAKTITAEFIHNVEKMATWAIGGGLYFGLQNTIGGLIRNISEVEKEFAGVIQVLPQLHGNQKLVNETTNEFIGIAEKYGQSINDVLGAAKLWGRQYKDINEVMQLVNATTLLSVVDNLKLEEANKSLEAAMLQFGMNAKSSSEAFAYSMKVVDSWSNVAHNAMVSAKDLAEGTERTGAVAKMVGVSFDELQGLIGTAVRNTGLAGANIGNAFKTIFGSIHSKASIQEIEKLGIAMTTVANDGTKSWKPINEVLHELMIRTTATTRDVEGLTKAASGGKFQWAKFAATLGDYTTFIKTVDLSINSVGRTVEYASIQLDTLAKKFERLQQHLIGLSVKTGQGGLSDGLKDLADSTIYLVSGLEKMDFGWVKFAGTIGVVALAFGKFTKVITELREAQKALTLWQAASAVLMGNWGVVVAAAAIIGVGAYAMHLGKATEEQNKLTEAMENAKNQAPQYVDMYKQQSVYLKQLAKDIQTFEDELSKTTDPNRRKELLNNQNVAKSLFLSNIDSQSAQSVSSSNFDEAEMNKAIQNLDEKAKKTQELIRQNREAEVTVLDLADRYKKLQTELKSATLTEDERISKEVQLHDVTKQLNDISPSLLKNNKDLAKSNLDLANAVHKATEAQKEKVLVDLKSSNKNLNSELNDLSKTLESTGDSFFQSVSKAWQRDAKADWSFLFSFGKLGEDGTSKIKKRIDDIRKTLSENVKKIQEEEQKLLGSGDPGRVVDTLKEEEDARKEYNTVLNASINKLSDLENAYSALSEGKNINPEKLIDLINNNQDLAKYIDETNDKTLKSGEVAKEAFENQKKALVDYIQSRMQQKNLDEEERKSLEATLRIISNSKFGDFINNKKEAKSIQEKFNGALEENNLLMKEAEHQLDRYVEGSAEYTQALEDHIALIEERKSLMEQEIELIEQQIKLTQEQQSNTLSGATTSYTSEFKGKYKDIVNEAAMKYNIDAHLISAIIQKESSFNSKAVSSAGAKGLMQLMDGTAKDLGVTDSFDPKQNIMGGVKYLAQLLEKFNGNFKDALAAYNAGPGKYQISAAQKYADDVLKIYNNTIKTIVANDAKDQTDTYAKSLMQAVATKDSTIIYEAFSKVATEKFGLQVTSTVRKGDKGDHGKGAAIDVAGAKEAMDSFAKFVYELGFNKIIYKDANTPGHETGNHVHVSFPTKNYTPNNFITPDVAALAGAPTADSEETIELKKQKLQAKEELGNLQVSLDNANWKKAMNTIADFQKEVEKADATLSDSKENMKSYSQSSEPYRQEIQKQVIALQNKISNEQKTAEGLKKQRTENPFGLNPKQLDDLDKRIAQSKTKILGWKNEINDLNFDKAESEISIYEKKISDIDEALSDSEERLSTYPEASQEYRNEIQNQIKLLNDKKVALDNDIKAIEKQIKNPLITAPYKEELQKKLDDNLDLKVSLDLEIKQKSIDKAQSQINSIILNSETISKARNNIIGEIDDSIDSLDEDSKDYFEAYSKLLDQKVKNLEISKLEKQNTIDSLKAQQQAVIDDVDAWEDLQAKIENASNELESIDDDLRGVNKTLIDNRKELANEIIDIYKEVYSKQKDLALDAIESELDALDKAHDKKMDMLDEELSTYEDIINAKLESIDEQASEEDYNKNLTKAQKEAQDIQNKINVLLPDDSHEAIAEREELQKQLADKLEEIEDMKSNRTKELRKDNLEDSLDAIKKEVDAKKDAEDDKYDAEKERLDNIKEQTEKFWDDEIAKLNSSFDNIEDHMDRFEQLSKTKFTSIGDSITKNLINKVKDLTSEWGSLNTTIETGSTSGGTSPTSPSTGGTGSQPKASMTKSYDGNPSATNGYFWIKDGKSIAWGQALASFTGESITNSHKDANGNIFVTMGGKEFQGQMINGNGFFNVKEVLDGLGLNWKFEGDKINKYHDGGWVGTKHPMFANLNKDEVPAILKNREFVLSENMLSNIGNSLKMPNWINSMPKVTKADGSKTLSFNPIFNVKIEGGTNLEQQAKKLTDLVTDNMIQRMKGFGFI